MITTLTNMKSSVYILECKDKSYYIGSTKNLQKRLLEHRNRKVKSTKNCAPFSIKLIEEYNEFKLAFNREKQLKSWKKRSAIERLFKQDIGPIV